MIDVEAQVFTKIADVLRETFPGIFVAPEYVRKPPHFPAVSIVEMDNTVLRRGADSGGIEHFAQVMYQVDVYSSLNAGKKAECKAIIGVLDTEFAKLNFTRTFLNPVPNMDDATIYRMTGRYTAVINEHQVIFRS